MPRSSIAPLAHTKSPSRVALLALATGLGVATPARAWEYEEHKAITRHAMVGVCTLLAEASTRVYAAPEKYAAHTAYRITIARGLLCGARVGDETSPRRSLNLFRFDAEPSCHLEPETSFCRYDLGDAVGLIDLKNDPSTLRGLGCSQVPELLGSFKDEAYEALVADEHFHPLVRSGLEESMELAEARAALAREEGDQGCPAVFHRALFNLARALHLLQDSFSSGHAVTSLRDDRDPRTTTFQHDEFNKLGLLFGDRVDNDSTWVALGDRHLTDPENSANAERVQKASEDILCAIVANYVGPEVLTCAPLPERVSALVPQPMDTVRPLRLLGGLLTEYSSNIHTWEGSGLLRQSQVAGVSMGFAEPIANHLLLRVAGNFEWFYQRGMTTKDYEAGKAGTTWTERRLRGISLKLGLEWSSTPWERVIRTAVFADGYLGWANVDCTDHIGCLVDGISAGAGPELLLYYATFRIAPFVALRRSAVGTDRWSPTVGLSLGLEFPRFNLFSSHPADESWSLSPALTRE